MCKTAFAAGIPAGDVDDVLQEGYLKIWRNAGSFDGRRASAITWMCTIIRNTSIDAIGVRKLPTSELDEALSVPVSGETVDDDGFDFPRAERIAYSALQRLPEERRRLIALAYIEGESRATLSRRFGVPVGTIKTWLHRALQSARKDCLAAAPIYQA